MQTTSVNERLFGTWKCVDDDCTTRIIVSRQSSGRPSVEVVDLYDGEKLEVSGLRFSPRTLSFRCHVPSTGHQTMHKMILQPDGSVSHHLTILESWVKDE